MKQEPPLFLPKTSMSGSRQWSCLVFLPLRTGLRYGLAYFPLVDGQGAKAVSADVHTYRSVYTHDLCL